jgi:hypothetical protein
MRRAGLVTLLLLVGACGREGGPAAEPAAVEPTTAPSITLPSATTTAPSTTTLPSTTTTTVPPWTTLPEPDSPPVLLGGLTEKPVESMCLEVTAAGSAPPGEGQVVEKLAAGLRILGVEVSSEGCEATLRVSLTGRRSSATYQQAGTCWSGIAIGGETTLILDTQVRATWPFALDEPPPTVSYGCPTEDEPIDWHYFGKELWHDPFYEMFGNLANVVSYHIDERGDPEPCWEGSMPPTEEAVAWLAAVLAGGHGEWVANWMGSCLPAEYGEALLPLVPHLIALDRSYLPGLDHDGLLARITGRSFDSPEEAWAWWEQQG